jgi:hypothetical protein
MGLSMVVLVALAVCGAALLLVVGVAAVYFFVQERDK